MVARRRHLVSLTLSISLIAALFAAVPTQRAYASDPPTYSIAIVADGVTSGSYAVPAGNPDGITIGDVASEFGFTLPLILATNTGTGWGDCDADGDTSDAGDYVWPTVAAARDGANYTFTLCGGEEILFPTLIDGAAISVVAGEGDPAAPNAWNGTSMISSITGTSGTFVWDGMDYFGALADPDEDGISFVDRNAPDAAEGAGTKVVVSASGYGVAAVDLERTAWDGTADHYTIVKLKSNGRPMEVVNAFGGQTTNIVADGAPCTFYATTSTSPSVWRSFDCGGTWSPVVLSSDERAETTGNDGVEGMDKNSIVSGITTSGWPGEVAVIIQSKLWFSRDFGTTWNSFDLKSYTAGNQTTPTALAGTFKPYWAHAYDETDAIHSSYLFLVGGLIGGPTGPLQALTVYATVMPTGDEYSVVDDNITGTDNPCDGTTDCALTEIKPGQFFALDATMKSNIAGAPGGTTRGTWTGWLFDAKPGVDHVYVATQQGATGGVVIAELPQGVPLTGTLYTSGDLKTALTNAANFTTYSPEGTSEARAAATLFEVKSPFQDEDLDGCADGCALSRDTTVSGGQAAQDLMVFGGPSGWLAEDINNDSTEDNGTLTTDYEGPRSVVIWDRSSSGPTSTATVRIATWVTNDRAITALSSYDNTDHWETAATSLAADLDSGDDHVVQNNLYSRNGNSSVGDGCSEDVETEAPVSTGAVGQVGGGGDAGLECESNNPGTPDDERRMMASCGENTTPAVGSVAPMLGFQDATGYGATSGEYYGTVAMIRSCIVVHGINVKSTSDIGGAFVPSGQTEYGHVVVMDAPGANNNTGSAFDAGFNFQSGTNGSSVVLSGDGARGLVKAATWKRAGGDGNVKFLGAATANYVPLFPQASHSAWNYIANRADPGTTSSSGGFAVTGLAAPVIRDTAFNPSDPNGVVATFSFTGGGRSVISYDGGQTYYTFAGGGANSISWWKGANEGSGASEQGRNWILSGSLTGGGFSVAHFTDDEWLTARDIANGVLGDSNGDLSDGVSGCTVGVDPNCVTVDFDAPVETMSGSALVAGAIREERANPTDPGAKTTGCMDATNVGIRGDMFDGAYFGLSGSADTVSITGIQGTDTALVVLGSGPSSQANTSDAYTVVLVKLKADGDLVRSGDQPCVDDLRYLNGTSFVQHPGSTPGGYTAPLGRIGAVAYCPKDGVSGNSLGVNIADAVEDLLLIAVSDESSAGGYDDGKLIKISGIYGNTISVSSPTSTTSGYKGGDYRDLKMDCDTGLVFAIKKDAGTGTTASTAAALYSLDGATTFAPMGFASALALKSAIGSAETIAVEADPTTGAVDVVVVASGGSVVSVEMDLEEMMPAATTLADLNDELSDALGAVADDPSAEGDVSTVNDPNSADGFFFGGEKPGDIDYPASEDEAPDLTVDGTDSSEFAPAGFGIASASDGEDATPIFGSGGGALDVTAKMPAFTFGASLTVPYKYSHASATGITGWHQLPATATESGATQTYAVASTSSAYCEVKTSGGRAYLHIKKPGTCKVGITAAAAAPYLAGTNYYVYTLSKGTLGAPSIVPTSPVSRAKVIQTLGLYADDANTVGYQTSTSVMPKITWSEITTGVTASKNACVLSANKLTLTPVAADAGKTCKIKGTAATSTNWGAWTTTYTITFP
ncbi:MAG: hypothetical protein NTV27_05710 [Chloroflexi bacterium]|nr:hypothetical protein [Chloroflexota bacterium]